MSEVTLKEDYQDLLFHSMTAACSGLKYERFFESDIGQFTAIAYHPMRKSYTQRKNLFTGKNLLTMT